MGVARCFDFDDYQDANHDWTLERLTALRDLNEGFRCTLFGITAKCSRLLELPEWVEVAPHGWEHSTPTECSGWSFDRMVRCLNRAPWPFQKGFKAPGWQLSDEGFRCLREFEWWVADQEYNRDRRPKGLRVYEIGPDDWHGHIGNVCGNGIEETWDRLVATVRDTERFELVSERAA